MRTKPLIRMSSDRFCAIIRPSGAHWASRAYNSRRRDWSSTVALTAGTFFFSIECHREQLALKREKSTGIRVLGKASPLRTTHTRIRERLFLGLDQP
jgi:hypothetical protein